MLNKDMDKETEQNTAETLAETKEPDVVAGIYVRGHVKISDPETGKVILETAS